MESKTDRDLDRVVDVSVSDGEAASRSSRGFFSADWWTAGRGWSGVAQWPNPAICVWLLAAAVGWADIVNDPHLRLTVAGVGHGALIVWALDELLRGTSPLRRSMGACVLIAQFLYLLN